jgi:hypothetical protein
MTCYRCQGHWCWVCRQKIKGYDHFESLFGGCFGGGISCGGCYLGILLAQLIILALSPIIVYFVVLYEAIKNFSFWQLLEPITNLDLISQDHYDYSYDQRNEAKFMLAAPLVGILMMLLILPIAAITLIAVVACMLYKIGYAFAIRFLCCCCN